MQEKNEVVYVTFPVFSAYRNELVHGFSTRLGGVSREHLASMNLSFTRGDDRERVLENHRRFAEALGYDEEKLVFSDQVHGTDFYKVTREDCGKGIVRESDIREIDGLVTNEPGVPIITFYADCVPLFFYDKAKKVIAMAHSGWRGTVEKIGAKMVSFMSTEYGSRAEDILCAIAPSICQKCYEVSEDVAMRFLDVFGAEYGEELLYAKENGKYQLNLHKACEVTLLEAGIQKEHIEVTDICTCCNPEIFFSHRASGGKRGNLAGVMMIKQTD
ncbi:MAG: peptidoglycan editing factor PgeF [Bacteroidales bacterium]|nr:peptidoglycan editing factor PgeF [Clostridium sp.]MCM1203047.1 peptidoglycan editing factor PgeF [Bacteroidales bacterium]